MAMAELKNDFSFTFRCEPPWQDSPDSGSSDTLCFECKKLDLGQSFNAAHELYEDARRGDNKRSLEAFRKRDSDPVYLKDFHFVTSLGNRLSRTTLCKLCNFFARMTPEPRKGTYKVMAFCSSESYLFEPRRKDIRGQLTRRPWEATRFETVAERVRAMSLDHNVFMALVPEISTIPKTAVPVRWFETGLPKSGAFYRLTAPEANVQRLIVPRELPSRVSFGLLRAWLGRCRCHHVGCARRMHGDTTLPGFKVIDCQSLNFPPDIVERPWSQRYVALSYVWGPPSGDWPKTIMDAIEVTRRMGERFLWVDRTCIDQSNSKEKLKLINKMDAIYAGAEFTIVCATGDARSGLSGVGATPRKSQPFVQLSQSSNKSKGKNPAKFASGSIAERIGVSGEDYAIDAVGETHWLDDSRFGLVGKMDFDFEVLLEDQKLRDKYDIPKSHLEFFRQMAEDDGHENLEKYLELQAELARRIGIPLKELVPYFKRECAASEGWDLDPAEISDMPIEQKPLTPSSKPRRSLPPNKTHGTLTLVSTMQEPRLAIKQSTWATRGWTYQEGVLSNRRLVFTEEQVYWECRGMVVCESVDLALGHVHEPSGARMADFMLSGIFDDDLHDESELQYGFQQPKLDNVDDQVVTLDGHIQAFTCRNLTDPGDTLRAFTGVANTYITDDGLCLLLGLPIWAGACANDKPGLQHTFALSLSSWTHIDTSRSHEPGIVIGDCTRRPQFPSWSWAGWQGTVEFCNEKQTKTSHANSANKNMGFMVKQPGPGVNFTGQGGCGFETAATDPNHSDFFKALTSKTWVSSMDYAWSAEMILHEPDGSSATTLAGWTSVHTIGDPEKPWQLTIRKPLVLRHMNLKHPKYPGEWRRLDDKVVSVHLSVPIIERQLVNDYRSGHLRIVLVLTSMIPFVYDGIARFLVLRRADEEGRWERIGRMNMWITEAEMMKLRTPEALISALPVRMLGEDIILV
ncbi:hypothetical protein IAQ61_000846 [Plenodomus lingam]|uniref:uncharacterized protein n=1 Tax=Leptosphaeria maculans TaxID=5022 RepID=UPI00332691F0|nr:hypothetical protein IAQ61_000846 [Plenodomus lingam]